MAHSVNFHIDDTSESDSDFENLGENESGEENFFQPFRDPGANKQWHGGHVQMEVFGASGDSLSTTSEDDSDGDQQGALGRCRWTSATLKMLSLMPSRATASHGASPSSQLRPRQRRQAAAEEISPERSHEDQLVHTLRGLSVTDGTNKLRAMPLSLAKKRKISRLTFRPEASTVIENLPCSSHMSTYISRTWRRGRLGCLATFGSLQLWHSAMKRLSGRHGTSVLSYFLFLRTLLFLNLLIFLVNGLFVVFPQAVYPPPAGPPYDHELDIFPGVWLITGMGYLSQSLMFYGYYSNTSIDTCPTAGSNPEPIGHRSDCNTNGYSMPTAYFFTIAIAFFVICIILVYRISKSFGKHFHVFRSGGFLAVKVFCAWDFKVSKRISVRLQSEKISTQLKEQLSERTGGEISQSCVQRLSCFIVHMVLWIICLASIFLGVLGIHYLSEAAINGDPLRETELLLLLSAAVSLINLLLPGLFDLSCITNDSPAVRVYISIIRNLLLKISIIGALSYRWLGRIAIEPESPGSLCWETFVGQELYRLVLMDFILTSLYTLIAENLWRIFSMKLMRRKGKPVFDVARNVLELIYGQTLTWLGVPFAPLLPAVQIAKLFVLFYVKKSSVMCNYQASRKPWRATQMTTLFLSLLFFPSFLGAAASVTYTLWMTKPSSCCGPFRNLTAMYESSWLWSQKLTNSHPVLSWLSWAYKYLIKKPLFLFLTSGVFIIVIYIQTQIVDGQRRIIRRIEKQIENEGMDKRFLISKVQMLSEQNNLVSPLS